jgi:VWFA-related protein
MERFVKMIGCALLVALIAGIGVAAGSQDSLPTFRSGVVLVPISAVVRDRRGRIVTTLTAADFEVRDKGENRRILDFRTDETSPITIALLLDVSGSMRIGPKLGFARQVLNHLVGELQDGRDEVGMFTFDAKLHEQQPFTVHPTGLDQVVSSAEPFGTTSLYDAIAATARRLNERPAARRALVVFTDGVDTSSELTPAEVSGLASSIDVPVYIVVTVPPIDLAQYLYREVDRTAQAAGDLRDLALWTGGELLWTTANEDAGMRARQILSELRHQYLIAIESAAQGEWRPLEIKVRDRGLTVRARSGYFSRDNSVPR